jgi:2-(1,2-epoxy-1,2-dihydrophenyl)acetyl-CoA isomerase
MTREQRVVLIRMIDEAAERLDVRAVVITGSEGSFCTGADLGATIAGHPRPEGAPDRVALDVSRGIRTNAHRLITAIMDCEKPVIAAVNGVAAGMGVYMALACDLVVMSDDAALHEVFVQRGIVPDSGAAYLLGRVLGPHRAKQLLFFGGKVTAADALAMGLVNRVVPAAEFDESVAAWAAQLASSPTRTIALAKSLVNRSLDLGRDDFLALEAISQDVNMATEDAQEGVRAFLQRRPPEFRGW